MSCTDGRAKTFFTDEDVELLKDADLHMGLGGSVPDVPAYLQAKINGYYRRYHLLPLIEGMFPSAVVRVITETKIVVGPVENVCCVENLKFETLYGIFLTEGEGSGYCLVLKCVDTAPIRSDSDSDSDSVGTVSLDLLGARYSGFIRGAAKWAWDAKHKVVIVDSEDGNIYDIDSLMFELYAAGSGKIDESLSNFFLLFNSTFEENVDKLLFAPVDRRDAYHSKLLRDYYYGIEDSEDSEDEYDNDNE